MDPKLIPMPTTTTRGNTGSVTKVQLKSAILRASWSAPMACIGGEAPLEVRVQHVADGSDIQIEILDEKAKKVESYSGKIYSGLHRKRITIPETKSSMLVFTAKMAAHKLEAISSRIQVLPRIQFGQCQHIGPSGGSVQEITDEGAIKSTWTIAGAPQESEVEFTLLCRMPDSSEVPVWKGSGIVQSGKTEIIWAPSLPEEEHSVTHAHEKLPTSEKYEVPVFRLKASCLGATATCDPLKYTSWVHIDFGNSKGEVDFLFPDGRKETKTIPDDGVVRLKGPAVGKVKIVATRLESKPSDPLDDEPEDDEDPNATSDPADEALDQDSSPGPDRDAQPEADSNHTPAQLGSAPTERQYVDAPQKDAGAPQPPPVTSPDNAWKLPFAKRPPFPKKKGEKLAPGSIFLKPGKPPSKPKEKSSLVVTGLELGGSAIDSTQEKKLEEIHDARQSTEIQSIVCQFESAANGSHYYARAFWNGRKQPDPTIQFFPVGMTESEKAARRVVWEELKLEGNSSSINAYDGLYRFSWGRGFLGSKDLLFGSLGTIFGRIFQNKSSAEFFQKYGIDFSNKQLMIVNEANKAVEVDGFAYALAQSDPSILAVFSLFAEQEATRQEATNQQWTWIYDHAAKVPEYAWSWPPQCIALAGHFVHWLPGLTEWKAYQKGTAREILLALANQFAAPPEICGIRILKGSAKDIMVKLPAYAGGIGYKEIQRVCPQPLIVPKGWFDTPPNQTSSTQSTNSNAGIFAFPVLNGKDVVAYYFYPVVPAIPGVLKLDDISAIAHLDNASLSMKAMLAELGKKKQSSIEGYCSQKSSVGIKLQSALQAVQLSKANANAADKKAFLAQPHILAFPFDDQQTLKGYLDKNPAPADNAVALIKDKKWQEFIDGVQGRSMTHLLSTLQKLKAAEFASVTQTYDGRYGPRFTTALETVRVRSQGISKDDRWAYAESPSVSALPQEQRESIVKFLGLA